MTRERRAMEMWTLGLLSSHKQDFDSAIQHCEIQASLDPEPKFWVDAIALLRALRACQTPPLRKTRRVA